MKSARNACATLALAMIVGGAFGCGNDDPDVEAASGEGDETSTPSETPPDGNTTGESGLLVPRACQAKCTAATDCATAGAALYDADNYACTAGKCEHLGCLSTQECADTFKSAAYVCDTVPGTTLRDCVKTCAAAADCAVADDVLFDEDNYACTAGKCEYLGCNSTQECTGSVPSSTTICATILGTTLKGCVQPCTAAADCAVHGLTLFDEDNYACTAGQCQYKGCTSTQECTDAYLTTSFVCE